MKSLASLIIKCAMTSTFSIRLVCVLQTAPFGTENYSKPVSAAQFHQILEHYPLGEPSLRRPAYCHAILFMHSPHLELYHIDAIS